MKRNLSLIREILLHVEERSSVSNRIKIHSLGERYSENEILYHLGLLYDAGYINAEPISAFEGSTYLIRGITWEGHDYLDAVQSDTVWNQVQCELSKVGGTASLEAVKFLATKIIKGLLE